MNSELDETTKPLGARFGEAFFCIGYLIFAFVIAFIMQSRFISLPKYLGARPDRLRNGFGFMLAFLLGFGDAFHLIPRIILNLKGELKRKNTLFGLGNLISSITMTVFYMQIIIAVVLSFLFYLPVAIFAHDRPKLGILMIPKTMCYIWMLSVICFF